jgi:hypothetical protein
VIASVIRLCGVTPDVRPFFREQVATNPKPSCEQRGIRFREMQKSGTVGAKYRIVASNRFCSGKDKNVSLISMKGTLQRNGCTAICFLSHYGCTPVTISLQQKNQLP